MIDYEARGLTIGGIPSQWLTSIQSASFKNNIPMSWLAAVCELSGWDPNRRDINYFDQMGRTIQTVRRFGLAGVWASIPEVIVPCLPGTLGDTCSAGNFGCANWLNGLNCNLTGCYGDPNFSQRILPSYQTVLGNLDLAAQILKECAGVIQQRCGGLNALVFLRWMWGCTWLPQIGIDGKCVVPPGLPAVFKTEMDNLVEAQRLYAEHFNEPPIVPGPLSVALGASPTTVQLGATVTFQATPTGGAAPYSYAWNFGDGQRATTSSGSTTHAYAAVGNYDAAVQVTDNAGNTALSLAVTIIVSTTAPPPPAGGFPWWLVAVGGVAAVGVLALAKRCDTPQCKREKAAKKRMEAVQLRAQGKVKEADQLDKEAAELERQAAEQERAIYQFQAAGRR